ncbi:hypothetical protein K438DRAFT_1996130 [Mycena galopus ATCC 62051]|nr:hypothetical protein K438DRAFT_1996130 [Mycena galopus ATCC 62051]
MALPRRKIRRVGGKHLEIVGSTSTSAAASISVSTHSFTPQELSGNADDNRPIETFVEEPSADLRRIHRRAIPIEPPSPTKKERRIAAEAQPAANVEWLATGSDTSDERYNMLQDWDEDPAPPAPAPLPARARDRLMFSDPTLQHWKNFGRDRYLLELLRLDGCAGMSTDSCPGCEAASTRPAYCCRECHGGVLFCRDCCVHQHLVNPLHVVEAWNGSHFVRTSLKTLGLWVQLGHRPGEYCASPQPGRQGFVVLHQNGVHEVEVDFCGCEHRGYAGLPDIQLLHAGWYQASEERPQTCMTLLALEQFHIQTLQAKMTMYDCYKSIEKLTCNDGTKPPDRYQVFIRIAREYRHLMMLKRGGRGHDPGGAKATKSGELAVRCPVCPRPGLNLPEGWENTPKEDKFIYNLFMALDACFRLKRGLVSSELKDPGLGTGWSYMLENEPYREYLLTVTDQKEMSTCSGLAALDYANTKFSRGYSTTGVGMGVCARHEFIQPNGVGDLQRGERYANMDYITGSILRVHDIRLAKVWCYDIVCQWWQWVMERLKELPPLVHCEIFLHLFVFVIPKMHIKGHTLPCGVAYSLNYVPGSGQTDGEGIKRPWSNIGGIASSTRIMGPGARHDTIDDHWSHWNWQKLISLAEMLRRRLDNALEQERVQREALETFSAQQRDRVEGWKKMVHDYEAQPKEKKNPYNVEVIGLTENQVRLQFQNEEEEEAKRGIHGKHKVSPSEFMTECLDVEAEQRKVRVQAELKKKQTTIQQIDLGALRTKLIRRLLRLRKLQQTYCPASILALENRDVPADEQPENEPLFLPSALSSVQRALGGCTKGLLEIELLMRDAQCRSALVKLRNQLYQAAWNALFEGENRDEARVGWRKLRKDDIRCIEDAEDLVVKEAKRRRAKDKRKRKFDELVAHGVDVAVWMEDEEEEEGGAEGDERAGESWRKVSWIWMGAGTTGTDAGLTDALRVEWAKVYARSRRWSEEVHLLKEEFWRLPISLEFEADRWAERARAVDAGELVEAYIQGSTYSQGASAYAWKQEALFRDLAARARETEKAPKVDRGKKQPRAANIDLVAAAAVGTGMAREEGEEDEDEGMAAGDDREAEEEQGRVESDEEVVMGGELDDF